LPSRSGYRDSKQRLELTTDYDEAFDLIRNHESKHTEIIGAFRIAIPVDEVITATLYLPEIHTKYFPHRLIENEPLEMD
jgi:hypothetical protein